MRNYDSYITLLGRVLMAHIFVISGAIKFSGIGAAQGYMASVGLPGFLVYPTIILELGTALAVIVGYQTRAAALSLAAYSVVTAILFHMDFDDKTQFYTFLRNFAMAGGFLFLAAQGPGALSIEGRSARKAGPAG